MADPAVRAIDVVVDRNDVHIAPHRLDGDGIVVDGQTIAEDQGVGIGRAQSIVDEPVVVPSDLSRPPPHRLDPLAARTQRRNPLLAAEQLVERTQALDHEIVGETAPVPAIVLAEERRRDAAWYGCRAASG